MTGHTSPVHSVAFSPDGRKIVSGSSDNTLRVWDADSRLSILGPLVCNTDSVIWDGRKIVSGLWDKTLHVWDADSGSTIICSLQDAPDSVLLFGSACSANASMSPEGWIIIPPGRLLLWIPALPQPGDIVLYGLTQHSCP
jgi:WD40 repeat protein